MPVVRDADFAEVKAAKGAMPAVCILRDGFQTAVPVARMIVFTESEEAHCALALAQGQVEATAHQVFMQ